MVDPLMREVFAHRQAGRLGEAIAVLDKLLAIRPGDAAAWNNRGNILLQMGRLEEALHSYDRAITLNPDHAQAWHNRAVVRMLAADESGAEADFDRALHLKPDFPEAVRNRGVMLGKQGRHAEALASYDAALEKQSDNVALLRSRADLLLFLNRLLDALSSYDRVVALDGHSASAWHNRGTVLARLGRLSEALEDYRQAIRLQPDFADAWSNRGSTLLELNRTGEALASYDKALALAPDHFEALKSRGALLNRLQRHAQAAADFNLAVAIRPGDAGAWQGRGCALAQLNRDEEALASFAEALRRHPQDLLSLYNRATIYARLKQHEDAVRDFEALLSIDPDFPFARGLLMDARLHLCDWRELAQSREAVASALRAGRRVIHPFCHLAISASAEDQLQCARILVRDSYPPAPIPLYRGECYSHDRLRVAYLSADFYEHATPFLMAGVFEQHDRERFETFGISFGPNDRSAMRARLENSFAHFFDFPQRDDAGIAAALREFEIDLAIDLKGFTGGARPGILAHRPAPVQATYLGYPGTLGAEYIDCLIADRIVIPETERRFYSEQIVWLPDSYQCNDSQRRISSRQFLRTDENLPEAAFVFCCFNGSNKIVPETFDIWMRILRTAENSVLWLLQANPTAMLNLRREAEARGVASERLVFAKRIPLPEHLARLKLADLALDTLPYGAHTTASDALWAGVPVLTRMGETFAGRVAASLLNAIGLPELIAYSAGQYHSLATELAQDRAHLAGIRTKLAKNRETTPLFDTRQMTRSLEAAYIDMCRALPNAG
jgi:predicted O-linked N-acetylglucosamine transferase (SPINDLY family)